MVDVTIDYTQRPHTPDLHDLLSAIEISCPWTCRISERARTATIRLEAEEVSPELVDAIRDALDVSARRGDKKRVQASRERRSDRRTYYRARIREVEASKLESEDPDEIALYDQQLVDLRRRLGEVRSE